MDLIKLITDRVKEVETSGKLTEIVDKNVLSCLEGIVKDMFRWSGEGKKSLEEALKGKLNIPLEEVNLDRYQKIVSTIVNDKINGTVLESAKENIELAVDSVLKTLDKKEWKLSEIVSKFIDGIDKSYDGDMDNEYGTLSLHVDESDVVTNYFHVYFDMEEDKDKYECKNKLFVADGRLAAATVDNKPFSPFTINSMCGFEKFLFQLYCNNVKITIDESDCELDYYREDYD